MQFAFKQKEQSDSLSITNRSTINWRYHIVSVLLFIIKVQYKLLLLIPIIGIACLYFPLLAAKRVRNGWRSKYSRFES